MGLRTGRCLAWPLSPTHHDSAQPLAPPAHPALHCPCCALCSLNPVWSFFLEKPFCPNSSLPVGPTASTSHQPLPPARREHILCWKLYIPP